MTERVFLHIWSYLHRKSMCTQGWFSRYQLFNLKLIWSSIENQLLMFNVHAYIYTSICVHIGCALKRPSAVSLLTCPFPNSTYPSHYSTAIQNDQSSSSSSSSVLWFLPILLFRMVICLIEFSWKQIPPWNPVNLYTHLFLFCLHILDINRFLAWTN